MQTVKDLKKFKDDLYDLMQSNGISPAYARDDMITKKGVDYFKIADLFSEYDQNLDIEIKIWTQDFEIRIEGCLKFMIDYNPYGVDLFSCDFDYDFGISTTIANGKKPQQEFYNFVAKIYQYDLKDDAPSINESQHQKIIKLIQSQNLSLALQIFKSITIK